MEILLQMFKITENYKEELQYPKQKSLQGSVSMAKKFVSLVSYEILLEQKPKIFFYQLICIFLIVSASRPMHPDFVIPIGQIFPIQIVQLPETLKLQIIEGGTIKSTLVAEIKLPIR